VLAETETYHALLRSAAGRLTGTQRRLFIAEVTQRLCGGSPRRAERLFGWSRNTANVGLHEAQHGISCLDNFQARGRQRTEELDPPLADAIRDLADRHSQADPQLKNDFRYTRLTAAALKQALIEEKGYRAEQLPSERTLQRLLNRMGYRIKRIQKTKPRKKLKETDAIFANVTQQQETARQDSETLDISIDTKAKVSLGDYSRGGESRSDAEGKTPGAWDHDPPAKKKRSPSAS
jgi:hypothetical protein